MRAPHGRDSTASAASSEGASPLGRANRGDGPGAFVVACSALAGDPVVGPRGEHLGTLDHLMIDIAAGRVAYGVLARGGVLGLGAKLFAVPWSAFALDAERKCFVLDVTAERLRRAPGFDREHWPAMADPAFARSVEEYYRQPTRDGARSLVR